MTRKSLLCEPRAVQALSACACTHGTDRREETAKPFQRRVRRVRGFASATSASSSPLSLGSLGKALHGSKGMNDRQQDELLALQVRLRRCRSSPASTPHGCARRLADQLRPRRPSTQTRSRGSSCQTTRSRFASSCPSSLRTTSSSRCGIARWQSPLPPRPSRTWMTSCSRRTWRKGPARRRTRVEGPRARLGELRKRELALVQLDSRTGVHQRTPIPPRQLSSRAGTSQKHALSATHPPVRPALRHLHTKLPSPLLPSSPPPAHPASASLLMHRVRPSRPRLLRSHRPAPRRHRQILVDSPCGTSPLCTSRSVCPRATPRRRDPAISR